MSADTTAAPSARRWGFLAASSAGRFAVGFQFQALPALAPALAAGLGLGLSEIGTLTGIYMLPGVVIALVSGVVLQRYGVRNALTTGLAVMAMAGAAAYFAAGFYEQMATRLAGGFGAVLATVAALKGLFDWFAAEDVSFANGISSAAQPFGMGCALLFFSALGAAADWRMGLLTTGAVAAAALIATLVLTRPNPAATGGARGRISLFFPRPEFAALMAATVVLSLYAGCFYAFLSLFPSYLYALGWAPGEVAPLMGVFGWVPIVMAPTGGFVATRMRNATPMIALCFAVWGVAVIALLHIGVTPWIIVTMLVFGPLPLGAVMSLIPQAVAPERLGMGSGVFMAGLFAGATVMPSAAGWIGEHAPPFGGSSEGSAILFCAIVFLFALVPLGLFEMLKTRKG